jgi:hypothetical protein
MWLGNLAGNIIYDWIKETNGEQVTLWEQESLSDG